MKVYILTEGGEGIGFGHITRMISLYSAFKEKGIDSKFIVNVTSPINSILEGIQYEINNWIRNKAEVFREIKKSKNLVTVIVDSYLASETIYHEISEVADIPVYYDDFARIDYPAGIVLNGNPYAVEIKYPQKNDVIYLLGAKYLPIRKEFWEVPEKKIKNEVSSVLITFGGTDIADMTPGVIKEISRYFPHISKKVAIGRGFRDENVKNIIRVKDEKTELIFYPSAEDIKKVMLEVDIAISAGGQTIYELARVGVPTIAVAVAENQKQNIEFGEKVGFLISAGACSYGKEKIKKNIIEKLDYLISKEGREKREEMSHIGRRIVDGKGSLRVVDFILKYAGENRKGIKMKQYGNQNQKS